MYPSTPVPHTLTKTTSSGIPVRCGWQPWHKAECPRKSNKNAGLNRASITGRLVGISGWTVNGVWIQMYESNQPTKHYNRFF